MKRKRPSKPAQRAASPAARSLTSHQVKLWMGAILTLYVALSLLYNRAMPFLTAPDEGAHLLYTKHIAQKWELPVLDENVREEFESHQPPLYYVLALPFYWIGRSFESEAMMGFVVRLLSTMLGIAILMVAHRTVRLLLGDDLLSLLVPALIAFLPMHLAVTSSFNNDPLAELVFFLIFYQAVLALKEGLTPARSTAAGLWLGIALLSKGSTLVLFPTWLLVIYLACRNDKDVASQIARHAAIAFGVAFLIGGWWLVRNARLYGDPLATRKFMEFFHRPERRDNPEWWFSHGVSFPNYLVIVAVWTFASWLGVFGHMETFMDAWIYWAFALVTLAAISGTVRHLKREWKHLADYQRQSLLVFGVCWAMVLITFWGFNLKFFQAQGRYLFPALLPAALMYVVGIKKLLPSQKGELAALLLVGGMGALSMIALFAYLFPKSQ